MTAEMVLSERPWYREPWPWILISGPAVVVVAGFVTLWLAVSSSDGLVAEDYYKQGLAINRVIEREEAAQKLGLTARVVPVPGRLVVRLSGTPGAHPPALFVRLAHATRAGHDLRLRLVPAADGRYEAELPALPPGHWHVQIEDPRASWRIAGLWTGAMQPFVLGVPLAAARTP
jgi:hypothetical protein